MVFRLLPTSFMLQALKKKKKKSLPPSFCYFSLAPFWLLFAKPADAVCCLEWDAAGLAVSGPQIQYIRAHNIPGPIPRPTNKGGQTRFSFWWTTSGRSPSLRMAGAESGAQGGPFDAEDASSPFDAHHASSDASSERRP